MAAKTRRIELTDDLGEKLVLGRHPDRIVSLVPSITETLIELGAGAKIVGITEYCVHPKSTVAGIAKVGGTKGLSIEKIHALHPDLVIANKEENRKPQIDELREKYPVFVTYPRTVEQAMKTVADLGVLAGRSHEASEMTETCDHILTSTSPAIVSRLLRTACMIWRDPWMAVGPDSYTSDLLERFGFRNVFSPEHGRYPETTPEGVADLVPDVIILPNEPYEFGEKDKTEIMAIFDHIGCRVRVLLVEGSYLTWFGYRTIRGLGFLRETKTNLLSKNE